MEDIATLEQLLSPTPWEDTQLDLTVDPLSSDLTFEDIEAADAQLDTFEFEPDDASLLEFYSDLSDLDPVETAEARALISELEQASTAATLGQLEDAAISAVEAQKFVLDTFQTFAPRNRKRRTRDAPVEVIASQVADEGPAKKTKLRSADTATVTVTAPSATRARSDGPQRTVPWRKRGSPENARMRAAVWIYRFAPRVRSKTIQQHFNIAVKSLMRYVYDSCEPEFAAYDLYFGPAGKSVAGKADRALKRKEGRVSPGILRYVVDHTVAGVPELARRLLEDMLSHSRTK